MAKSNNNLCVYTALHGPQLTYAENLCRTGKNHEPFCFRSNRKWKAAADYLESHKSMPVVIRDIEDADSPLAVSYSADLVKVRFNEDFKSHASLRNWLKKALWLQREFYKVQKRTQRQFQEREMDMALKATTNFLITNLRRVKRVPISRLKKADGIALSPEFKYGYAVCRMPMDGSTLYNLLTTPTTATKKRISQSEREDLDKKFGGGLTPITAKQIDAILLFLDRFEAADFSAGSWKAPEGQIPSFNFAQVVTDFHRALCDNGWVTPAFDWAEWQQSAQTFIDSRKKVERADANTIQKLLTTHCRADRFCEGHLAAMFANGHIVALLRRLKVIRGQMTST